MILYWIIVLLKNSLLFCRIEDQREKETCHIDQKRLHPPIIASVIIVLDLIRDCQPKLRWWTCWYRVWSLSPLQNRTNIQFWGLFTFSLSFVGCEWNMRFHQNHDVAYVIIHIATILTVVLMMWKTKTTGKMMAANHNTIESGFRIFLGTFKWENNSENVSAGPSNPHTQIAYETESALSYLWWSKVWWFFTKLSDSSIFTLLFDSIQECL